jgi:hypothetical protein
MLRPRLGWNRRLPVQLQPACPARGACSVCRSCRVRVPEPTRWPVGELGASSRGTLHRLPPGSALAPRNQRVTHRQLHVLELGRSDGDLRSGGTPGHQSINNYEPSCDSCRARLPSVDRGDDPALGSSSSRVLL